MTNITLELVLESFKTFGDLDFSQFTEQEYQIYTQFVTSMLPTIEHYHNIYGSNSHEFNFSLIFTRLTADNLITKFRTDQKFYNECIDMLIYGISPIEGTQLETPALLTKSNELTSYYKEVFISNLSSTNVISLSSSLHLENWWLKLLTFFSTELFLFLCLFVIFGFSLIGSKLKSLNYPLMQLNTILLSVFTLTISLILLINSPTLNFTSTYGFEFHFSSSSFLILMKFVFILIMTILFLLSLRYTLNSNKISFEFSSLLLFSTLATLMLLSCNDLIGIYLLIELQSFCFYLLTGTKTNSNFSTEAGLKYFILGSLSSGLLLFGISLLYGFTGLTNLIELNQFLSLNLNSYSYSLTSSLLLSLILILISILFKLGLVPYHMYVPDVYTGAPTLVTTLFLSTQKLTILVVYLNLYNNIFITLQSNSILNTLVVLSVLSSIIVGSVTALAQSKVKRLIAYSAIVNSGYLLIGALTSTLDGIASSIVFLIVYIVLILNLLTIYLVLTKYYNNLKLNSFKDFTLLKKSNLAVSISFALVLFSIAGIPPLAGFYGKLFLFTSAVKENFYALAVLAILFTVVTSYYYVRLIKVMFFESELNFTFLKTIPKFESYLISICTILNLTFFISPKFLISLVNLILLHTYY